MNAATPEQVLESIVTGINSGDLDSLMPLYEGAAAFADQPGNLAHGAPGIRGALTGFISMNGTLDLEVTRVLEVDDLALVVADGRSTARARTASRCDSPPRTPTSCAVRPTGRGASSSTTRGAPPEARRPHWRRRRLGAAAASVRAGTAARR